MGLAIVCGFLECEYLQVQHKIKLQSGISISCFITTGKLINNFYNTRN